MNNVLCWTMKRSVKKTPLTVFALCALVASGAMAERRPIPKNVYACQVQTESGVAGLVGIQAIDVNDAQKSVVGESALTLGGGQSTARSVIECIVERQGKFRDSHFQAFYKNLLK